MKKKFILLGVVALVSINLSAHCQVPCGIYHDAMRIAMLIEDVRTIEKAMNQIQSLSKQLSGNSINTNQAVRWINTKEDHANQIQEVVTNYFLTQRIRPKEKNNEGYQKYVEQTLILQQILVSAMKCKQTVDLSNTLKTSELIDKFVNTYLDEHGKEHLRAIEGSEEVKE